MKQAQELAIEYELATGHKPPWISPRPGLIDGFTDFAIRRQLAAEVELEEEQRASQPAPVGRPDPAPIFGTGKTITFEPARGTIRR